MLRIEESEAYKMILEKGAKEKSLRIAKELLKEGMDINKIAKITELSIEEIKKLMNWKRSLGRFYFYSSFFKVVVNLSRYSK